ncbi:MAG: GGDEF domain-containing protein [Pseudomonadales bacterium]
MSLVRKPLIAPLVPPFVLLALAAFFVPIITNVTPELMLGLKQLPYYLLILVATLSLVLNRTREAGAAFLLIIVYFCIQTELQLPLSQSRPGSVYFLLSLFVPSALILLAVLPEKRTIEPCGMAVALIAPLLFLAGILILKLRSGLHEIWLPRADAPTILSSEGFYLFVGAILCCLLLFFITRESTRAGVFFAGIFSFVTLNWLQVPMISTVMMLGAGISLFAGAISSVLNMLYSDELTGLLNRKALNREMEVLKPGDILAMADIDKFKLLNDTHGHDTGDEVLKLVAAFMSEVAENGKVYRYGGEEFSLVFRKREVARVLDALQSLRKNIASYQIAIRNRSKRPKNNNSGASYRKKASSAKVIKTSISIGVVVLREGESPFDALKRADAQLYRAKQSGRNCICSNFR